MLPTASNRHDGDAITEHIRACVSQHWSLKWIVCEWKTIYICKKKSFTCIYIRIRTHVLQRCYGPSVCVCARLTSPIILHHHNPALLRSHTISHIYTQTMTGPSRQARGARDEVSINIKHGRRSGRRQWGRLYKDTAKTADGCTASNRTMAPGESTFGQSLSGRKTLRCSFQPSVHNTSRNSRTGQSMAVVNLDVSILKLWQQKEQTSCFWIATQAIKVIKWKRFEHFAHCLQKRSSRKNLFIQIKL